MHIHPGSPNSSQSEESAATKIQAGFRGYRVRKQLKQKTNPQSLSGADNFNNNNNNNNDNKIESDSELSTPLIAMDNNLKDNFINGINDQSESRLNGTTYKTGTNGLTISSTNLNYSKAIEDKCATKIQAGVRGYLARKHYKREQEAATKIQAGFRGFKARKELQKLKQK